MLNFEGVIKIGKGDAVIVVDATNAFGPNGGLPVPGALDIIGVLRELVLKFKRKQRFNVFDAHPKGHINYRTSYVKRARGLLSITEVLQNKVKIAKHALFTREDLVEYLMSLNRNETLLWDEHAEMTTDEIRLFDGLRDLEDAFVLHFPKGTDPRVDSYSAFRDTLWHPTGLGRILKARGIKRVFIVGLAFDFCVGFTAEDAALEGFESYIVRDCTRSVGLPPAGDYPGSIAFMEARLIARGVKCIHSDQIQVAA